MARTVFALSLPAILAELSTTLMQYIDASMVGGLGAHATAAIGVVESTIWLFDGLAMSAAMGFTVQVAQLVGAGRLRDARNVMRQSLVVLVGFGLLLAAVGRLIAPWLPIWMGGDPLLWADATAYFSICACSMVPVALARLGTGMLQCSGDMRTPSVLNVLTCVLDVCFNALLIQGSRDVALGPVVLHMPGMGLGINGAALGTLLAQALAALLLLWCTLVRSPLLALRRPHRDELRAENGDEVSRGPRDVLGSATSRGHTWLPQAKTMRVAWGLSWPMLLERMVTSAAYVLCTAIVAPLGVVATAANSLAITAESVCYMPGMGIEAAATTLVGQAIGAERRDVARSFARMSTGLGMLVMSVTGFLLFVFAPQVMAMLTPDVAVQELGVQVLRIEAFSEPLFAASLVACGALRGAGDTLLPSVISLASMWGVRIPLMMFVAPRWGLPAVWLAMAFELCVRGTLFLVRLLRGRWLTHATLRG
jgi:Na+-driven multidrug efflux pump